MTYKTKLQITTIYCQLINEMTKLKEKKKIHPSGQGGDGKLFDDNAALKWVTSSTGRRTKHLAVYKK